MEQKLKEFNNLFESWSNGFFMTSMQLVNLIIMEIEGTINNKILKEILDGCWDYGMWTYESICKGIDIDICDHEWHEMYWALNSNG